MAATYIINGVSPESLGVVLMPREETDTVCSVSLKLIKQDALRDPPFTQDQKVVITRDDGSGPVGWFVGYAQPPRYEPALGSIAQQLTCFWKHFEQTQYLQLWGGVVSPRCILYGTPADGAWDGEYRDEPNITASSAQQLGYLLQYAIGHGVEFQIGTLMQGVKTGPREVRSRFIADLISEIMLQHPLALKWVDWTTKVGDEYVPTLNFCQAGDGEGGTAPDTVTVAIAGTRNPELNEITARTDLVVPAVFVRLEEQENDGTVTVVSTEQYPASGVTGDELRALHLSMTLDQRFTWNLSGEGRTINNVDGPQLGEDRNLAHWLYDQFSYLHYDGDLLLTEAELTTDRFTGKLLNISDGRSEWATMDALIQRVTSDPQTGSVRIGFGVNRQRTLPTFRSVTQGAFRQPGTLKPQQMRDAPPFAGAEPSTTLTPYVWRDPDSGGWNIRVTPGEVQAGSLSGGTMPTLAGTALDAVPRPGFSISPAGSLTVYLFVEFTPDVGEYTNVADDGSTTTKYRMGYGGDIVSAHVVSSMAVATQAPAVDPDTGDTTNGKFYAVLGTAEFSGATPTVAVRRRGNLRFATTPPARIQIVS